MQGYTVDEKFSNECLVIGLAIVQQIQNMFGATVAYMYNLRQQCIGFKYEAAHDDRSPGALGHVIFYRFLTGQSNTPSSWHARRICNEPKSI